MLQYKPGLDGVCEYCLWLRESIATDEYGIHIIERLSRCGDVRCINNVWGKEVTNIITSCIVIISCNTNTHFITLNICVVYIFFKHDYV